MKSKHAVSVIAFACLVTVLPPLSAAEEPTGQKTLAATMGVYVYPTKGQTSEQQSMDEVECYDWAVKQTETDPFDLAKQAEEQKKQSEAAKKEVDEAGKGAGAKGAVGGAAAGAAVGKIAKDDAGKGAAYGAAAGGIAAKRKSKKAQADANKQIDEQAEAAKQANQKQLDDFKKAFSVCLESKEYMVK